MNDTISAKQPWCNNLFLNFDFHCWYACKCIKAFCVYYAYMYMYTDF
jgi:hypothetical protein